MKKLLGILFFGIIATSAFAQDKFTLSGYIKDKLSGETLIAANLVLKDDLGKGTSTNIYGFYSITLEPGEYTFLASYLGYGTQEFTVNLIQDTRYNIDLTEGVLLEEIVVSAKQEDANVQTTEMGTIELPVENIKTLPAFLGEVDIMKTIQLLPGVLSAGEGNSGFYVRGGGPDQNLILLDEAVVYNTGHLLGFFSVFNADAIKNTTLIKGGMPAQYGGRLSSVVDVQMKDGNNKSFALSGGIGLLASRLTFEGPIVKNKSSFIVSARRTYAFDLAQSQINSTDFAGTNYYFYDLNIKANYILSDKDRLFLSGYFGRDVLKYNSLDRGFELNMPWGNATTTLRWNHLFSDKLFMNISAIYNDYEFKINGSQDQFRFSLLSGVRDWNLKADFDYFPSVKHLIKFGLNYTYHTFAPNIATASAGEVDFTNAVKNKYGHEVALYIQDDYKINEQLSLNYGVRFSQFTQVGPYTSKVDSAEFKTLEPVKTYRGVEPRISGKYSLDQSSSIKAGVSYTKQYIHLVTSSTSTLPSDLWVPSTELVKPQQALQYALGYFKNFKENTYETSLEVYYKDLWNQIEYDENFVPNLGIEDEDEFVFGRGRSFGAELFLKKSKGKLNGWIGYTLSRTIRNFDDIEDNITYPAKYDRTHDLSVVANYQLAKKWTLGGAFIYGTGNAYTPLKNLYYINFNLIQKYGPKNSAREDAYHRLDLSATFNPGINKNKNFQSSWAFSIYNVYNRKNTFFRFFDVENNIDQANTQIKAYKVSLFPIIPAITWNFKWKNIGDKTVINEQ